MGLCGIANFGSTCFMNAILQSVLHNPMMRAYFLAARHRTGGCHAAVRARCLGCNVETLFSAAYAPGPLAAPLSPSYILHSMWLVAHALAGYEQQDAHEFLIALLDGLHSHCVTGGRSSLASGRDCDCVVHRTFQGLMRSDLVCLGCSSLSVTRETFVDVSLEVLPGLESSLYDCLDRFTSLEDIGLVTCEVCSASRPFSKQLSLDLLPVVLCIHLKRFEHSGTGYKIESRVRFPLVLDLDRYVARAAPDDSGSAEPARDAAGYPLHQYELFAIVSHTGALDTGHYVNYVRAASPQGVIWPHSEEWFCCNDGVIQPVPTRAVLEAEAYMLFYISVALDYRK